MRCLLLVLLVACGSPEVGTKCTVNGDCDSPLTCNTNLAAGYCTQTCTTPGSTSECSDGAICDSVTGIGNTCLKICKDTVDCGRADLGCNGVSGSNIKACRPN